jgi:hypothetical protein
VFITWGGGTEGRRREGRGGEKNIYHFNGSLLLPLRNSKLDSDTARYNRVNFLSYLLLHLLLNINGTMKIIISCEYSQFQVRCFLKMEIYITATLAHTLSFSLSLSLSLSHTLSVSHFPALSPFSLDISDNAALVLHLHLHPQESGSLTFYVPVILMEVDEGD